MLGLFCLALSCVVAKAASAACFALRVYLGSTLGLNPLASFAFLVQLTYRILGLFCLALRCASTKAASAASLTFRVQLGSAIGFSPLARCACFVAFANLLSDLNFAGRWRKV